MPLVQLSRAQWQAYLDRLAAALAEMQVEIEVVGLGIGAQVEADWLSLLGVSYDPKDDLVAVAAAGVNHIIHHPRQIHVDHEFDLVRSIEVVDSGGDHHILLFRAPLALPS